MHLFIVTFHETAIKYESELKTPLVLLDIPTNHNVGSWRSLQFKFCHKIIYLRHSSRYKGFSFMKLVT